MLKEKRKVRSLHNVITRISRDLSKCMKSLTKAYKLANSEYERLVLADIVADLWTIDERLVNLIKHKVETTEIISDGTDNSD